MYKKPKPKLNTELSSIATQLMWFSKAERANPRFLQETARINSSAPLPEKSAAPRSGNK